MNGGTLTTRCWHCGLPYDYRLCRCDPWTHYPWIKRLWRSWRGE